MYWTLELARYLEDAPWPAAKDELIDFAMRTGSPLEVVENLQAIEDEGEIYDTIEEIWVIGRELEWIVVDLLRHLKTELLLEHLILLHDLRT